MHGFRKGRFRYIGRSLPCIRLSSHLYLSKITWLNVSVYGESVHGFLLWSNISFFSPCNQRRDGWQWRSKLCFICIKSRCLSPQDARPSAALGAPGATGSESLADNLITQCQIWPPGSVSWPENPTAGSSSPGLVASLCSPHWPEHRASWPHLHYWACALLPHKCPLCWASPWLGKDNAF